MSNNSHYSSWKSNNSEKINSINRNNRSESSQNDRIKTNCEAQQIFANNSIYSNNVPTMYHVNPVIHVNSTNQSLGIIGYNNMIVPQSYLMINQESNQNKRYQIVIINGIPCAVLL